MKRNPKIGTIKPKIVFDVEENVFLTIGQQFTLRQHKTQPPCVEMDGKQFTKIYKGK